MSGLYVSQARQLHRRVHGLGTRRGEEHARLGHGRDVHQNLGQLLGGGVGERVERGVRGESAGLTTYGRGDVGSTVSHGAIPEAGHAVDVFVAPVVVHDRPLTANEGDEVVLGRFGERVQEGGGHGNTVVLGLDRRTITGELRTQMRIIIIIS